MITKESVVAGVGCSEEIAALWLEPIEKACREFRLDKPELVAAFLAVMGAASENLSSLAEKTDYTAEQLCVLWPFKYALDSHVERKTPNALAYAIGGNPERVANNIYAARLGNGREASGDGWRYRGRGPLRLTGKAAFAAFWARCGACDPGALEQPAAGAMSAAFIFEGSWKKVVESGGFEAKANDELMVSRYIAALSILTEPPPPSRAALLKKIER
jgi:putative chitinase